MKSLNLYPSVSMGSVSFPANHIPPPGKFQIQVLPSWASLYCGFHRYAGYIRSHSPPFSSFPQNSPAGPRTPCSRTLLLLWRAPGGYQGRIQVIGHFHGSGFLPPSLVGINGVGKFMEAYIRVLIGIVPDLIRVSPISPSLILCPYLQSLSRLSPRPFSDRSAHLWAHTSNLAVSQLWLLVVSRSTLPNCIS